MSHYTDTHYTDTHYTDTHYTDGYKIPITPTEVKFIFPIIPTAIMPTYLLIFYLHKHGNFRAICSRIYSHYTDTHYTDGYKIPITPTEDFTHYTDTHYTDIASNYLSTQTWKFPSNLFANFPKIG